MKHLLIDISCFEPLFNQFSTDDWANGFLKIVVRDVIEGALNVRVEHPLLGFIWSSQEIDLFDGIMAASTGTKSVAYSLKSGFPARFKGIFDHCLKAAVHHDGNSQWPELVIAFRDIHSSCWFRFPRIVMTECVNHSSPSSGCFKHQFIYPRRLLPSIDLCYSSDTHESVR